MINKLRVEESGGEGSFRLVGWWASGGGRTRFLLSLFRYPRLCFVGVLVIDWDLSGVPCSYFFFAYRQNPAFLLRSYSSAGSSGRVGKRRSIKRSTTYRRIQYSLDCDAIILQYHRYDTVQRKNKNKISPSMMAPMIV